MKSTYAQALFGGRVMFEIFGKEAGNMSVAQLADPEYQKKLGTLLAERGIGKLLAPNPSFGSRICTMQDLGEITALPGGSRVFRGCKADGAAFKEKGVAFGISSADCATGVFFNGELLVGTHCGTKCLADTDARAKGLESDRQDESIVQSAISCFHPDDGIVQAFVGGSIAACHLEHPFDHPTHGVANRTWVGSVRKEWPAAGWWGQSLSPEHGCIDLKGLFKDQASQLGIKPNEVETDSIDTWEQSWWSNRRGDKERNLVIAYLVA